MKRSRILAGAKLGITEFGIIKLGIIKLSTEALKVKELTLLIDIIFVLLGGIVFALFLGLLSLVKVIDLNIIDLNTEQSKRFF